MGEGVLIWGEEKCEIKRNRERRLMRMPFSVAGEWFVEYGEGWHGVHWTVTTHLTVSALDLQDLIPLENARLGWAQVPSAV